ncbi:Lrp/AsnC family transcriptional regulator [Garicola koreensis]|uniref:DNA-binding Lrp family transcriptional regulator n=1 Tax=Garicola koreensis TaxID=1262554 RepID=A0A7W5TU66_9MICC|nr:Lrp/AsnC family transcriptional regulator [Garicola koreensis]MBB3666454.1 DNA-binding Lrp family transcriptional regulator [Garicola koreensis]
MKAIDDLDLQILLLCVEQPRAGIREYARQLQVARGTVQARLENLQRRGIFHGWQPVIDPTALGYESKAFIRLNLAQGVLDEVTEHLVGLPEVMEADSTTGDSDILCVVVTSSPQDLEEAIQRILAIPGVHRTRTETVLRQRIPARTRPLLQSLRRALAAEAAGQSLQPHSAGPAPSTLTS